MSTRMNSAGVVLAALMATSLMLWLLPALLLAQGTTFTVSKTQDTNDGVCDADCSLREAIIAANAGAGAATL